MIFSRLQIIIFLMAFSGCGKTDEKSSASELDGTWSYGCYVGTDPFGVPNSVSGRIFYEISSGGWINTSRAYDDTTCSNEALVIERRMDALVAGLVSEPTGARELDIATSSALVTVKSDRYVTLYNQTNGFCGGGLVKDVPKTLTQAGCANDESIRKWFEKVFTIYKVDGSKLYLGKCDSADQDCSSNSKRAKKISEDPVFTKG